MDWPRPELLPRSPWSTSIATAGSSRSGKPEDSSAPWNAAAGAELLRLPGAQVGRGEPVDLHAERVERGAVNGQAGAERVVDQRTGVAELRAVGQPDHLALVADQLADR